MVYTSSSFILQNMQKSIILKRIKLEKISTGNRMEKTSSPMAVHAKLWGKKIITAREHARTFSHDWVVARGLLQVKGSRSPVSEHCIFASPDRPRLAPSGSPGGGFMIVDILYLFVINVVSTHHCIAFLLKCLRTSFWSWDGSWWNQISHQPCTF